MALQEPPTAGPLDEVCDGLPGLLEALEVMQVRTLLLQGSRDAASTSRDE